VWSFTSLPNIRSHDVVFRHRVHYILPYCFVPRPPEYESGEVTRPFSYSGRPGFESLFGGVLFIVSLSLSIHTYIYIYCSDSKRKFLPLLN
jgi:hypothetical protein